LAAAGAEPPRVVLNEVMYHPPDDRDDLQYVELFNPGESAVNLAGWSFTKGLAFVFPRGTELSAGGYLVVGRELGAFRAHYGAQVNVAGAFSGKLSHQGERLELADATGRVVDTVKFEDRAPWPLGADGYGSSLERICPVSASEDPANWTASEPGPADRAGGTPGRPNSAFSVRPLPEISDVHFETAAPGKPTTVTATVADPAGVQSVVLHWWVVPDDRAAGWTELPMSLASGDGHRGVYAARVPPVSEDHLVRCTIQVRSAAGTTRVCPAKTEPRPTFSYGTFVNTNTARVPFLKILALGPMERAPRPGRSRGPGKAGDPRPAELRSPWTSAAVYLPPGKSEVCLFDHVQVRPRNGGLKVHFHRDQPLAEMTGINLIFEASPRWVLAEPLAYELYRKAGVPAPATQHVRLWVDQRLLGYHLLVEQPNKAFLRRHGREEDGNLYKLLWYGQGLVGQHEKKTNPHTGHQDLIQLVEGLNRRSGAAQWEFIQREFQVEEMVNYYAVNMCIQNWDGFFNNYFAYHDLRPGGRWEVFPWDEDKTWGDYDGASSRYDWYTLPLTFGMNGSEPTRSWLGAGPYGGASWWRPPGHFSGPLLANSEFRQRFLTRLRELCATVFTPVKMAPVIHALENRLEDEVRVRAELTGEDPAEAWREFRCHIQSFHKQVANRRQFILKELGAAR
jgi:hypothetical protein